MKSSTITTTLIISIILFLQNVSSGQITRGTAPGEIYINSFWYFGQPAPYDHYGVFRSTDNGETVSVQFLKPSQSIIVGDSLSGNVYLTYGPVLYRSQNYGISWDTIATVSGNGFISGCTPGEIYKHSDNSSYPGIYRSIDFGESFTSVNPTLISDQLLDVGTVPGEVYGLKWDFNWDTLEIKYSQDFGHTFSPIIVDTSIIPPPAFIGKPAILTRGTSQGEFYLIRMDTMARYRIYHTMDNGQTFEYNYITEPCYECAAGIPDVMFSFTAGREPGSFYIVRPIFDSITQDHIILCIDYSQDYGKTYTTYCHEMDSTYTGISTLPEVAREFLHQNTPNPFSDETRIGFYLSKPGNIMLTVSDIRGRIVATLASGKMGEGDQTVSWNGRDMAGNLVAPGVYLYQLRVDGAIVGTKKAIRE